MDCKHDVYGIRETLNLYCKTSIGILRNGFNLQLFAHCSSYFKKLNTFLWPFNHPSSLLTVKKKCLCVSQTLTENKYFDRNISVIRKCTF